MATGDWVDPDAGWYPYMQLGKEAEDKIEAIEKRWTSSLDDLVTFHVQQV